MENKKGLLKQAPWGNEILVEQKAPELFVLAL
jgi:hypothetical protein